MMNTQTHQYIDWYLLNTPFSFIPVRPDKTPFTQRGVKDATRSESILHGWINIYPSPNLAIATGKLSNCFVIDVDVKQGKGVSGHETLNQMYGDEYTFDRENFLWATTPSGGVHYFFEWDDVFPVASHNAIAENVDIKGNDGYVLVEPSVVIYPDGTTGSYQFHDITKPPSPILPWAKDLISSAGSRRKNQVISHGEIQYEPLVSGIHKGNREYSLFKLAWGLRKQGIDYGVARGFFKTVASNCIPPFPENKAMKILDRAFRHAILTPRG